MTHKNMLARSEAEASFLDTVQKGAAAQSAEIARLREALTKIANVEGEDDPAIMWPWAQEVARAALSE